MSEMPFIWVSREVAGLFDTGSDDDLGPVLLPTLGYHALWAATLAGDGGTAADWLAFVAALRPAAPHDLPATFALHIRHDGCAILCGCYAPDPHAATAGAEAGWAVCRALVPPPLRPLPAADAAAFGAVGGFPLDWREADLPPALPIVAIRRAEHRADTEYMALPFAPAPDGWRRVAGLLPPDVALHITLRAAPLPPMQPAAWHSCMDEGEPCLPPIAVHIALVGLHPEAMIPQWLVRAVGVAATIGAPERAGYAVCLPEANEATSAVGQLLRLETPTWGKSAAPPRRARERATFGLTDAAALFRPPCIGPTANGRADL